MLSQQIAPMVDNSIDPMTAVTTGAALYASTIDKKIDNDASAVADMAQTAVRMEVGYEATTVETTDWVSLKLAEGYAERTVKARLTRGDQAWDSGWVEVDERGRVVTVQLVEGRPNNFIINAADQQGNSLSVEPHDFTIIQGTRVGRAILPYHIGISVWAEAKADGVFVPLTGLEKNKPLPAVGIVRGRRTTTQLRPGIETDEVRIPVYQADSYEKQTRAYLYEWVADVVISGDEVPSLIPAGSPVEVTLHADTSEQMTLEAYFPEQDVTVEKILDTSKEQSVDEAAKRIAEDIASAYGSLYMLAETGADIDKLKKALQEVEDDNRTNPEKKAVLQHLKEVLRQIEAMAGTSEWAQAEQLLNKELHVMLTLQRDFGNKHSELRSRELQVQAEDVVNRKDTKTALLLVGHLKKQSQQLDRYRKLVNFVNHYDSIFDSCNWTDKQRARKMIDQAKQNIAEATTLEWLEFYTDSIWIMYIPEPQPKSSQGGGASSQPSSAGEVKEVWDKRKKLLF